MARLTLGLVGAAIGSAFGQPGAGFLVGSGLGSILFPGPGETFEGPRPGDLKISGSVFGRPITVGYGAMRSGGGIVDYLGSRVERREERQGGKGGPSVTTISYDLYASFAIMFTEGPIDRVLRIWANSRLIFDVTGTDPIAPPSRGTFTIRWYRGDMEQRPDPLSEQIHGVDDALAYRGRAYIVFEDLYLGDYGNSFPNIEVEYASGPPLFPVVRLQYPLTSSLIRVGALRMSDTQRAIYWISGNHAWKADARTGELLARSINLTEKTAADGPHAGVSSGGGTSRGIAVSPDGDVYVTWGLTTFAILYKLDPITLQVVDQVGYTRSGGPITVFPGPFDETIPSSLAALKYHTGPRIVNPDGTSEYLWEMITAISHTALNQWPPSTVINAKTMRPVAIGMQTSSVGGRVYGTMDRDGYVWTWVIRHSSTTNAARLHRWLIRPHHNPTPSDPGWELIDTIDVSSAFVGNNASNGGVTYYEDEHALIIHKGTTLAKFDIETRQITGRIAGVIQNTEHEAPDARGPFDGYWFGVRSQSLRRAVVVGLSNQQVDHCGEPMQIQGDNMTASFIEADNWEPDPEWQGAPTGGIRDGVYDPAVRGLWFSDGSATGFSVGAAKIIMCRYDRECVPLRDIITDLCRRSGIPEERLEFHENVDQCVRGYAATRQEPARRALEQLAFGFNIQIVESDWKLKIRTRTGESVLSIPYDQVVDRRDGNDPLRELLAQETELPRRVGATYYDIDQDYQNDTQIYQRPSEVTESDRENTVELPIVFNAEEAFEVAERALHVEWTAGLRAELALPPRYLGVDPGDVLTLHRRDGEPLLVRVVNAEIGVDYSLNLEVERDDPRAHDPEGGGVFAEAHWTPRLRDPAATELILANLPMLRDQDDNAGFYMAAAPVVSDPDWPGAAVFVADDGQTWVLDRVLTDRAVYGRLVAELTPTPTPWVWDDVNEIRVWLTTGEFESAANDVAVINGANTLAIGNEVVSFRFAEQLVDGSWRLTPLLRGRRGTEHLQTHGIGARVLKLRPDWVVTVPASLATVGVERHYRAITLGASPDQVQTPAKSFTNEAARLRTYAPVHTAGTRDGSNNLTITWRRRTRLGFRLRDFFTQPLGEASESYEVDVLDGPGGSVLRTIPASSPSASYTAAQQTTDGLTPGDPVAVRVHMLSATIGRGPASETTV